MDYYTGSKGASKQHIDSSEIEIAVEIKPETACTAGEFVS
jgi:hypothetical protein